jgi:DNA-binding GntR family transcriptional regulator
MQIGAPANRASSKRRTADELYERLRWMAMTCQIRPGERINELDLARRFQVSRTPLREALNRLVAEELLSYAPNLGFERRPLNLDELVDLYELRSVVEVAAIRRAVERAEDDEIARVRAAWDGLADRRPFTAEEEVLHDERFHEGLVALSGNREALRIVKSINTRIHFVRLVALGRQEALEATYGEHDCILDALAARDADAAARLLAAHLDQRMDTLMDLLKEGAARIFVGRRVTGREAG